jgi:hypothetical protein
MSVANIYWCAMPSKTGSQSKVLQQNSRWLKPALRTLSALLLAVFAASLFIYANKTLSVSVELEASPGGKTELFYNFGQLPFEGLRRAHWQIGPDERHTLNWFYRGYQSVTRLRLDPIAGSGEVRLHTLSMESRWDSRALSGDALKDAIRNTRHVENLHVDVTGVLRLTAIGEDPQLEFLVPRSFYWPGVAGLPSSVWLFVMATGAVWLLLELMAAALGRLHPPSWQAIASRKPVHIALVIALCAGLTLEASTRIGGAVFGDGLENLAASYNLYRHGILSFEATESPVPGNAREPLPPFVIALHIRGWAGQFEDISHEGLRTVEAGRLIKLSNLYWVFFGLLGSFLLALQLFRRWPLALLYTLLVFHFFFGERRWISTLYTELPAGSLLTWIALCLLLLVKTGHKRYALLAGLLMGALALTKSVFFYVLWVAIPVWAVIHAWQHRHIWRQILNSLALSVLLVVGISAVLTPWMARNALVLEQSQFSQRGGPVLYGRAVMNQMSSEEIKGALYHWGPSLYQRAVQGTDYAPIGDDLERGGRWQRLNRSRSSFFPSDYQAWLDGRPEDAISFLYYIGALYTQRLHTLQAAGHPDPAAAADRQMQAEARQMIQADPLRHIAMSGLFTWRGLWSLPLVEIPGLSRDRQQATIELINIAGFLSLMGVFAYGLLRARPQLLAVTLLPALMLIFYAGLTHNIPRYSGPAHPFMLLALILLTHGTLRFLWIRVRRRFGSGTKTPKSPQAAIPTRPLRTL